MININKNHNNLLKLIFKPLYGVINPLWPSKIFPAHPDIHLPPHHLIKNLNFVVRHMGNVINKAKENRAVAAVIGASAIVAAILIARAVLSKPHHGHDHDHQDLSHDHSGHRHHEEDPIVPGANNQAAIQGARGPVVAGETASELAKKI